MTTRTPALRAPPGCTSKNSRPDRHLTLASHFYPELGAGGYSRVDGSVEFYTRVRSLLSERSVVLDFGAGRGWGVREDPVPFRRRLQDLRGSCARVVGVDIDPSVLTNPALDESHEIRPHTPLPFDNESFDLILCDHVFEHLDDPAFVTRELNRVLRHGGWICARTPNRYGYIALGARMIPNALHGRFLQRLQPSRAVVDVFPTHYRLNTRRAFARAFPSSAFARYVYGINAEPAYTGRSAAAWLALWLLFRVAPERVAAIWLAFFRKGQ